MGRYLSELLAERQKLGPFMPVLPQCYRLLTQGKYQFHLLVASRSDNELVQLL